MPVRRIPDGVPDGVPDDLPDGLSYAPDLVGITNFRLPDLRGTIRAGRDVTINEFSAPVIRWDAAAPELGVEPVGHPFRQWAEPRGVPLWRSAMGGFNDAVLEAAQRVNDIAANITPQFFIPGTRVWHNTEGRPGLVEGCYRNSEEDGVTSVRWEILPSEPGNPQYEAHQHVRISSLRTTPVQQDVGTTNTELQGGDMPTPVSIAVRQTASARGTVFDRLNIRSSLLADLDIARWTTALQTLSEGLTPAAWSVTPGSFRMSEYPRTPDGNAMEHVSVVDANNFLQIASSGRLSLTRKDGTEILDPEDSSYAYLTAVHPIEKIAFENYAGSLNLMLSTEGEDVTIDLYSFRDALDTYEGFARSKRKAYIKAALQQRMGESVRKRATQKKQEWTSDRISNFEKFLKGVKAGLVVERNPLTSLPILPHRTLSSRTWGIEIEAVDIQDTKTPSGWELKGDGSLRALSSSTLPSRQLDPAYTLAEPAPGQVVAMTAHGDPCGVSADVESDCTCGYWDQLEAASLSGSTGARSTVGEWNSPILRSFHSRGLKYLTDEIEMRDTNNSAGVHVHVAAADLTPAQAVRLSIVYSAMEPLFQSAYMRGEDRTYCKEVDIAELISRFTAARKLKDQNNSSARTMAQGSRYWTVNLASLSSHGTIEFRAMGPVYNYDHLIRWAYLVRELVNVAKADVPQSAWAKVHTIKDLVTLFSKYGKETPTPEWARSESEVDELAQVIEALGSENRRVPHSSPLNTNASYQMVNDDYSSSETLFVEGYRSNNPDFYEDEDEDEDNDDF